MSRSIRMFEIVRLLRSARRVVTARALADELEVSVRTVYRDVAALQSLRVPIDGEAGVGYVLRPGFELAPLAFTAEELEALRLGLDLLARTADAELVRAGRGAVGRIDAVLSPERRDDDAGSALVSGWHAIPEATVDLRALRGHARETRELEIGYRDAGGARTRRTVPPLALVYYVDSVVLAGRCALRRDFRHFRIDRIDACEPTGASFGTARPRLRARAGNPSFGPSGPTGASCTSLPARCERRPTGATMPG